LFASFLLAQAYKIDEVGEVNEEEWTVRTENIRHALNQKPNAKGYVIIFRGRDTPMGFPIRLKERLRNHFIKYLALPTERFEILIGGEIENQKTELWIVPVGSEPPLEKSIDEKIDANISFQFDNFSYPTPWDGQVCCSIGGYTKQEKKVSLDKFAQLLKENPDSTGYLIVYGQYCVTCADGIIYLDSKKVISRILRKEKNYLVKNHKIESESLKTINGGYRKWEAIELWIVPKGEKPPNPTPNTFPRKKIIRIKSKHAPSLSISLSSA